MFDIVTITETLAYYLVPIGKAILTGTGPFIFMWLMCTMIRSVFIRLTEPKPKRSPIQSDWIDWRLNAN